MTNKNIKIILLGDEKVGKTSLFDKFIKGTFPSTYTMSKKIQFNKANRNMLTGESIYLNLWDTPGNEEKHKFYKTIYIKTSSIILLFDITNITSLDNIFKKWIPNFFKFLSIKPEENFPIIILGNFSDLTNNRALPKNEMNERIKEVENFTKYYYYQEISLKNENNLPIIMDKLFLFIMNRPEVQAGPPQIKPADNKKINFEDINDVNELKKIIRELKDEKIKNEKKEKMEKEKNNMMINSLNEKIEMLEQLKRILIDKEKRDTEENEKLNKEIINLNEKIKQFEEDLKNNLEEMKNKEKEEEEKKEAEDRDRYEKEEIQRREIEEKDRKHLEEINKLNETIKELNEKINKLEEEKKKIIEENERKEKEEKERREREEISKNHLEEKEKLNSEIKLLNDKIKIIEEEKKLILNKDKMEINNLNNDSQSEEEKEKLILIINQLKKELENDITKIKEKILEEDEN